MLHVYFSFFHFLCICTEAVICKTHMLHEYSGLFVARQAKGARTAHECGLWANNALDACVRPLVASARFTVLGAVHVCMCGVCVHVWCMCVCVVYVWRSWVRCMCVCVVYVWRSSVLCMCVCVHRMYC